MIRAYIKAFLKPVTRAVIPTLNMVLSRGNTVGVTSVTKDTYETNNGATTITVGSEGADYTTINLAWAAASAGDVIEILDDSTTLTARLSLSKTVDENGKAVKIKGKSTGTVVNMYSGNSIGIICATEGGSAEFENIIFANPENNITVFINYYDNTTGFLHFINCKINMGATVPLSLKNVKEFVVDGVETNEAYFAMTWDDDIDPGAKCIFNNLKSIREDDIQIIVFAALSTNKKYKYLSITNSDIQSGTKFAIHAKRVSEFRIEGNSLKSLTLATFFAGYEAGGATITAIDDWNNVDNYGIGDLVNYKCILYEALVENTNSTPNRDINEDWRRAKITTGVFRNNTITRDTYVDSGHAVFFGYGCYDCVIENNIFDNYWYNLVVKGHNNIIRYNCIGRGNGPGIGIYANDQSEVRNNTIRTDRSALQYGPQAPAQEGLINTMFRDNIFYGSNQGDIVGDLFERWESAPEMNIVFIKNIYKSPGDINYKGIEYAMPDNFDDFKNSSNETGRFIDPEFEGIDPTTEDYYRPTNGFFITIRDQFGQSVGAVDLRK